MRTMRLPTRDNFRAAIKPSLVVASLIGSLLAVLGPGCVETRVVRREFEDFPGRTSRSSNATDPASADRSPMLQETGRGWAIQLRRYTGPSHARQARRAVKQLQSETDLTDVWMRNTGSETALFHGRFADPQGRRAQTALERAQRLNLDGSVPFAEARLVQLGGADDQYTDPLNLKQHHNQYTLQIAYYDEKVVDNRRAVAERAARALREAGHEAYYYHGRYQSMVTIGVYGEYEALVNRKDPLSPNAAVRGYTAKIRDLREQFPYNLANPDNIIEALKQDHPDAQESSLVRVL